jgi:urease accessory protein
LARVALVQSRASLLSGDDVAISISVGENAALELIELGATLAYTSRQAASARISVQIDVEENGLLIWIGQPLIVARGAHVSRRSIARISRSAALLVGEAVVLGRAREEPGELVTRTRVLCDGDPMVDETLETHDRAALRSSVVAGDARMIAGITLAGVRDQHPPDGAMQAHGPGTLWRAAGGEVETERRGAEVAARWRGLVAQPAEPTESRIAAGHDRKQVSRSR